MPSRLRSEMSSTTMRSARRSSFTASPVLSTPGRSSNRKSKRGGVGVGLVIDDVHAPGPKQVGESGLAAEPVAVGVDVGSEADPLPGVKRGGERPGSLEPVGREGKRHSRKWMGASGDGRAVIPRERGRSAQRVSIPLSSCATDPRPLRDACPRRLLHLGMPRPVQEVDRRPSAIQMISRAQVSTGRPSIR